MATENILLYQNRSGLSLFFKTDDSQSMKKKLVVEEKGQEVELLYVDSAHYLSENPLKLCRLAEALANSSRDSENLAQNLPQLQQLIQVIIENGGHSSLALAKKMKEVICQDRATAQAALTALQEVRADVARSYDGDSHMGSPMRSYKVETIGFIDWLIAEVKKFLGLEAVNVDEEKHNLPSSPGAR